MSKAVYLVNGKRTPQAKSGADLSHVAAPYLGHYLIKYLADVHHIDPAGVDEVIVGNTGTPAKYPNVGRVIALEAGLHQKTSGYSVHRNCASGMEALSQAYDKISSARSDVIFAGGVENMTQMPLMYGKEMTTFFANMMKAKTGGDRFKNLLNFRLKHLKPIVAIEQGLTDPFCGKNMGQTAETLARELGITRLEQDQFADHSHKKAIAAMKAGKWDEEILPIVCGENRDRYLRADVGPREQSSVESLGRMKSFFEKETGTVTIGNSCPITDGGSMWLLMSEEAVKRYGVQPMARLVDYHFHGLEPERMGMGPLLAMNGALKRANLKVSDMDLVEMNEAFAAQAIAVLRAMKEDAVAARFGLEKAPGEIDVTKLNVNGGGIALGHPVGSTGSRLVVTLAHELKRSKKKYGIASLCIGGGQGGALIIENLMR
jgi:acetyl-CoA C-acetyltransferase/acetyl-CoA acyltransferase